MKTWDKDDDGDKEGDFGEGDEDRYLSFLYVEPLGSNKNNLNSDKKNAEGQENGEDEHKDDASVEDGNNDDDNNDGNDEEEEELTKEEVAEPDDEEDEEDEELQP
jgi:hypothetical protein